MKDEIFNLIDKERKRQEETIDLIPSENFVSKDVLNALGSCLVNKYAEGYPQKRYYQGNEIIDQVENLAIERAKKLFDTPHANVQSYSGSPANQAVYMATCNLGDCILGMDLSAGGHLTHGSRVSFSGKYYKAVYYGVDEKTKTIDYEKVLEITKKEKPKLIWCGATAYPRFFDWEKFAQIAKEVGSYLAADISHYAGLIAGKVYPSPVLFADIVTTTTHKTLRGPRGAIILATKKGLEKDPDLGKRIDRAVFPGIQGGPHENQIAAIAVALKEADCQEFKTYTQQIIKNAKALAGKLISCGFDLITGGTDCHLILVSLVNKQVTGKQAAIALEKAGIVCNANAIPFDSRPPLDPSGIRLGTPAVTTRGMGEKEMEVIAKYISEVVENIDNETKLMEIRKEVKELTNKYIYQ